MSSHLSLKDALSFGRRVVFFGSSEFSVQVLDALLGSEFCPIEVIAPPDRRAGRGLVLKSPPLKSFAQEKGLKVLQPEDPNSKDFIDHLRELSPEVCLVAAYGKMIKSELLRLPRHGFINVHPSLLPLHRGPSPIEQAIMDGRESTGVTLIVMDEEMDSGDIIWQAEVAIDPDETAGELEARLAHKAAENIVLVLRAFLDGQVSLRKQEESIATFTRKISPSDCFIDWNLPAKRVHDLIRALNPKYGARAFYRGRMVKIWRSRISESKSAFGPGRISFASPRAGLRVCAIDRELEILEIQVEGGKRISGAEFVRGYRVAQGEAFEDRGGAD